MPNSKQATKRIRQAETRRIHNKTIRTSMRSAMKIVLNAENNDDAQKALPMAMKRIDKAAKSNIIHANTAARYKSRVSRAALAK